MSHWTSLWLCIGVVYMFAISDRSHLKGAATLSGFIVELIWAFVLVAPAATGVVYNIHAVFR
jgi:hypothetical protein